mmetsp:Transcript_83135/g.252046  ORF Transcript_83135/g.252046 Transcript_83135/m.252046 type:complete len:266 (+) Transcript_83135:71-868(+)
MWSLLAAKTPRQHFGKMRPGCAQKELWATAVDLSCSHPRPERNQGTNQVPPRRCPKPGRLHHLAQHARAPVGKISAWGVSCPMRPLRRAHRGVEKRQKVSTYHTFVHMTPSNRSPCSAAPALCSNLQSQAAGPQARAGSAPAASSDASSCSSALDRRWKPSLSWGSVMTKGGQQCSNGGRKRPIRPLVAMAFRKSARAGGDGLPSCWMALPSKPCRSIQPKRPMARPCFTETCRSTSVWISCIIVCWSSLAFSGRRSLTVNFTHS